MPARSANAASAGPRRGSRSCRPATTSARGRCSSSSASASSTAGSGAVAPAGARDPRPPARAAAAAGLVGGQRRVEHERLAQREVQVDRAGPALQRGPVRAAGELAQPAHPLGRRGVVVDLEEPLGGAAVELDLVDRLPGAELAQLRRAVGGEHEQRHARLVRLDHRRRVVRRGGAGRAGQRDGAAGRLGEAEREERRRRARRRARWSAAAPRARATARAAWSASPATCTPRARRSARARRRTRAGPRYVSAAVSSCRGRDARPRPAPRLHPDGPELAADRPRAGGTVSSRHAGPPRPRRLRRAPAGLVRGLRRVPARADRRPAARSSATRWAAGSRCTPRSSLGAPRAAPRPDRREPGARRRRPSGPRGAADDAALADRIEAIGIDAFVREWGAQPLFDGIPRGVADLADADRRRNTAGRAGGGAARARHRRDAAAVGPAGGAGDAGRARGRGARREVPRDRRADGGARSRRAGLVVPGAGHAVHLEAPDALVELLGRSRGEGSPSMPPFTALARRRGRGRPARRSRRSRGASTPSRPANAPSVASPHHGSGPSAAAACTPGRDPERPVERRRHVDRAARRARRARVAQHAR